MSSVADLIKELRESGQLEKVAAQGGMANAPSHDEEVVKLAQDLYAGGRIFGRGVVDGMMQKIAEQPVSATGTAADSGGNLAEAKSSTFGSIADKVMRFKGVESPGSTPSIPGSNPNVVAEATAPSQAHGAVNKNESAGG